MHFDLKDKLAAIPELSHMEDKMFIVWDGNHRQVLLIARKFEEANNAVRKIHVRVDEYHGRTHCEMLKRYRSHHWDHAFKKWHAGIKSTIDPGAQPYFHCTARRIFYRWYRSASLYPILEHSYDAWVRSKRKETGLYPESWIDYLHSKDAWYQCPWWLDYPSDTYPSDKEESFKVAHTRRHLIEASSQRPPGQATAQSPLARPPKHTLRKLSSNKAPFKRPPIEPANKKRKKRGRGKSTSSEEDENIEDPDDEEADDVLDIDSQLIENLDGEDDPLGDSPDPLLGSTSRRSSGITLMIIHVTQTLLLAMFVRGRDIGLVQWRNNRVASQETASDDGFGERVGMLWEPSTYDAFKPWRTYHNGEPLRPDIEKSTQFARWLLDTFIEMGDAVMDIFAGTGGVASQCMTLHRHCISIEVDRQLAHTCLAQLPRVPNDLPFRVLDQRSRGGINPKFDPQLLIEVDLNQELLYFVPIHDSNGKVLHSQKAVYKTLPNVCFNCMKMGHFIKDCPDLKPQPSPVEYAPEKKDDFQNVAKKFVPKHNKGNKASTSRNRNSFSPLLEDVFDPFVCANFELNPQHMSTQGQENKVDNDSHKEHFPNDDNSQDQLKDLHHSSQEKSTSLNSDTSFDEESKGKPNNQLEEAMEIEDELFAAQLQAQNNMAKSKLLEENDKSLDIYMTVAEEERLLVPLSSNSK
ncbi:hypothetical protein L7F22_045253 [Adiantum nelumboides]|nr:hypothetical protein [Adiantum nelumboides]